MKNLWDNKQADAFKDDLARRVYSSRLLGAEADLVMHGGGNTSVKGKLTDVFGEQRAVLYVKGSGWDLKTIEAAGFPAVDLEYLLRLGSLESLSDSDMMKHLRLALLDPLAPTPSVEAILHALIPHRFVDHSHADAVVALSNTPEGEQHLRELYGKEVLILPYIMPGFILARQVASATADIDWQALRGIVLLHHGIFTFADDARQSYDTMIELVSRAEAYLEQQGAYRCVARSEYQPQPEDYVRLAGLRKAASDAAGQAFLLRWDRWEVATGFAALHNAGELIRRGPLTPDHSIHSKVFGAIFAADPLPGLAEFQTAYKQYYAQHAQSHHQSLDSVPRFGLWQDRGMLYLAPGLNRLITAMDIGTHTIQAIQWGEALGGWTALSHAELFEVEYWELEQAKLKGGNKAAEFAGRVALVSGAASGIGKATVEELLRRGAVVVALDIADSLQQTFSGNSAVLPVRCDVTDSEALQQAIFLGVETFGGLDILVSNAGNFPASHAIADMEDKVWAASMALNLTSHMQLLRAATPFLQYGLDPAVVIVGSKNVPAPGPGAAAYSTAKAGLTQLARVAALEMGAKGIRVNVLHPDGVFDTGIWTEEVLAERAKRYQLSVADYKRRNVLHTEITAQDVAVMVALFAGRATAKTTGAQIPVDGGNERVI